MAYKNYILVCAGTACESNKGKALYEALEKEIAAAGVNAEAQLVKTGCFGFCEQGPIVKILPDETFYVKVGPKDAHEIIAEHIVKGRKVERLIYKDPAQPEDPRSNDISFYRKQLRIVLRNCAVINPEIIDEYIARDGYAALEKALFDMTPDQVVAEITESGLRGRGGAGFPTGRKWLFTKNTPSDQKYVVCNADEGDPGAYMDRSVLEGDPHSVLEAMAIAGYSVGANKGFIYIRAEYPLAIERLNNAIAQAKEYGLLGEKILGTEFSFDIELRLGAGAFVCGEETALLASIEGKRGMPVPRPPFPAVKGLWGKPTVINNVETYANIPVILLKGADWFSSIGTATSKGTKVFALTGKINNSGLIEVPMGTTLRDIIYDIGGGIANGKKFKAVQTGGPSGGCITAAHLDMPIDYDTLKSIGSMMGSGGMIVMDEDDCMVDVAKFFLEFTMDESCGKCTPCRIGSKHLYEILGRITQGKGVPEDLELLKEIGKTMTNASLCGLGQTAANPVMSTIKNFGHEYEAHIHNKSCPASRCPDLISYSINAEKCVGCTACARVCPVNCISGQVKAVHTIDPSQCIKCGQCFTVCRFSAVDKK